MNSNIQQLADESHQIIVNARRAMMEEEITQDQYNEVVRNVILDVGYQTEVISQPHPDSEQPATK